MKIQWNKTMVNGKNKKFPAHAEYNLLEDEVQSIKILFLVSL